MDEKKAKISELNKEVKVLKRKQDALNDARVYAPMPYAGHTSSSSLPPSSPLLAPETDDDDDLIIVEDDMTLDPSMFISSSQPDPPPPNKKRKSQSDLRSFLSQSKSGPPILLRTGPRHSRIL